MAAMRPTSMRRLLVALSLGLVVAMIAACGSSDDASTAGSNESAQGAALYEANCAACHGSDVRGTSNGPSLLSIVYEPNHHGDDAFRSAVTAGAAQHHWTFGDMPAVPNLDQQEIDEIIAYVRMVQETEGFERMDDGSG